MSASAALPINDAIIPTVKDFVSLLKPRVSFVVTLTGAAGMAAAGVSTHPLEMTAALLALFGATGASGAFNMWAERDSDALMRRTADRPLPAGRMEPQAALEFSVMVGVISVILMCLAGGLQAAALLLCSIFIYCYVYTIKLKKTSEQNIVIGGLSGALPPMIGWAAAGGDAFSPLPILMTVTIFMWTPAHFWALAVARAEEYNKASIPMLPCKQTRKISAFYIAVYTALTVVAGAGCALFMENAMAYSVLHGAIAAWWTVEVTRFSLYKTDKHAMKAFGVSVAYMALICIFWAVCA